MKKIITEPLVHFMLISALFFIGYDALNPQSPETKVIIVNEGRIAQLKNSFVERWRREPLQKELDNAIHGFTLNEMYLREGRAMMLDVDDQVINRRLRQKMDYLLEDMASANEPSDEVLLQYYEANKDSYRSPMRYSLTQVYVSVDRSDEELKQRLHSQQQRIEQGLAPEGDPGLLPHEISLETEAQLERQFGHGFVVGLQDKPLNQWVGPVESSLGFHYLFLKTRKIGQAKPFSLVKETVLNDWQYHNAKSYKADYEKRLLALYQVDVQMPQMKVAVK